MKVIKSESITTKEWSGGTTKELYIFPSESDYGARDFTYRISTATVDVEESTFTSLPDYNRYLMILDGEMHIEHKGQHNLEMKPFDIDIFHGSWDTTSKGMVVDFNLMTSCDCDGILNSHIDFKSKKFFTSENEHKIIYVYKGKVKADEILLTGDILVLENNENIEVKSLDLGTILIEVKVLF